MKKLLIIMISLLLPSCCLLEDTKLQSMSKADGKLQLIYSDLRDQIIERKHSISPDDWKILIKVDRQVQETYLPISKGINDIQDVSFHSMDPDLVLKAIIQILPIGIELMKESQK